VPAISFKDIVINTRNAFLAISLLATIAFALIFSWGMMRWQKELFRSEQQKQLVLEKELEQLKSGLNPHFLFNSLSSLKILVSKKPEEAKSFAVALSKLYRYLLMQERLDLISLNKELEFTQNYIYLQQIRFSNFRVNISFSSISASKDSTGSNNIMTIKKLPPMSLQLLVENSIKHTKMSSSDPLVVDIDIQDKYIVVKNNYNPPESSIKSFADKDLSSSFDNKDLSDYTTDQRSNNVSGKGIANLTKRYSYLTDKKCRFYIKNGCFFAEIPLI
jgi:LytS/YehU family sensor histidine kinase